MEHSPYELVSFDRITLPMCHLNQNSLSKRFIMFNTPAKLAVKQLWYAVAICLLTTPHGLMLPVQANLQQSPTVQQFPKDSAVKDGLTLPWHLKWSDEFDKDGLPDPAKWGYEEGLVRNNEAQYYTQRRENARIEGGMLVIEGRKEELPNPHFKEGTENWKEQKPLASYTSASLTTQGKAS